MVKYDEGRAEESLPPVSGDHRERKLSNRVVGALGEIRRFFAGGDQLVLYINDRAARIIRRDFSVRVHLPPSELLRKIDCAYMSRRDAGGGHG